MFSNAFFGCCGYILRSNFLASLSPVVDLITIIDSTIISLSLSSEHAVEKKFLQMSMEICLQNAD